MPAASRPHRRVGIAGATVLALALATLLALPAPAAQAEEGSPCQASIGPPFGDPKVADGVTLRKTADATVDLQSLATALQPLIAALRQDFGTLPAFEVCIVAPASLPEGGEGVAGRLSASGAVASGAGALVGVLDKDLGPGRLAETVATGVVHAALYRVSTAYPADFAKDVIGWYLQNHLGASPNPRLVTGPEVWVDADWDGLPDAINWDPFAGYAYSGAFAQQALDAGHNFAAPDIERLKELAAAPPDTPEPNAQDPDAPAPPTTAAPTAAAAESEFPWMWVGVGALGAVFVASLTWLLIRRRRPVVTSAALPDFLQSVEAPPEPEPYFDAGQAVEPEAIAPPPITAPLPVVPPAPVMEPVPIPETPLPAPVSVSRTVRASASQPARPPAAPLLGEASQSADATGPIAAWETYAPHSLAVDSGVLNDFEVRAAAVIGAKNRLGGIPCQDAFALAQAGDRYLVTAVCDGVGSARLSHLGAQAVAEHMVARVAAALDGGGRLDHLDAGALVSAAGDTVRALAEGHPEGLTARDFATTLALIAVDTQAGPQEPALLAIRVGDSTVRLLDANGDWVDLFGGAAAAGPGEDSLLSTATVALPCDPAQAQSACVAWWAGSPVVAMTDGLANPMRDSAQVRAHFKGSWATPPDPLHFAADLSFRRRGALDDRTAVAIWRPVGIEEPPRD